ncbi:MAG: Nif3-like dinuclear metal center hexameric protein [Bacillota bacterium]
MKIKDAVNLISNIYPDKFTMDWDNSGIQVGNLNHQIDNILVTLDINLKVIEEALNNNCNFIISHHPLIFKSLKSISGINETEQIVIKALKNDLVIYSAHTNLDIAPGGLNDYLAEKLGLKNTFPLKITDSSRLYKLSVYIPENSFREVKNALLANGAGCIGNYSHTSFAVKGEGTFKPLAGSNPYQGKINKINKTKEYKLETIIEEDNLDKIKNILLNVHPYEEVAYDIFLLQNNGEKYGLGRVGELNSEIELKKYLKLIKEKLDIKHRIRLVGNNKKIRKVAICSGSGSDLIERAKRVQADIFITGDIKYHQAQTVVDSNMVLVDAGHYETEAIVKEFWKDKLNNILESEIKNINIIKSGINTNPWKYC